MEQMGKYQLIRKLASGGMAEVFLARSAGPLGFEKQLVVKRILPHLTEDPQFVEMFLAEARLAAMLNHAHIAQIFDFGQQDGRYFIAMEYIEGHNLRVLCRKAHERGVRLPFALCARLISMACEGLAYAHELTDPRHGRPLGLIHRDISADNLLLSRTGILKVVDFGIAKAASTWIPRTQTGLIKGKVAYMPPEQLLGKPLDARADLYALAVVLYELVAGRRPYEGESDVSLIQCILNEPMRDVRALREDVPKELEQIINRALSKDREARQASCRELQQELERFVIRCGEPVGPYQLAELVQQLSEPVAVSAEPVAAPEPVAHSMVAPTEPDGTQPVLAQKESATEPLGTQPLPRETPPPAAAEPPAKVETAHTTRTEPHPQPLPVDPPTQPTTLDRPPRAEMPVAARPPPLPGKAPPPPATRRPSREKKSTELPWRRVAAWGAPCLLLVVLLALLPGAGPTEPATGEATDWRGALAVASPPADEQLLDTLEQRADELDRAQAEQPESEKEAKAPPVPVKPVTLQIYSNLPGDVFINRKRAGKVEKSDQPLSVSVRPGRMNVSIIGTAEQINFDKSQRVDVPPGEGPHVVRLSVQKFRARFQGSQAGLKVMTIDRRHLKGEQEVEIYEGNHTLFVLHPTTGARDYVECRVSPTDKVCAFSLKLEQQKNKAPHRR